MNSKALPASAKLLKMTVMVFSALFFSFFMGVNTLYSDDFIPYTPPAPYVNISAPFSVNIKFPHTQAVSEQAVYYNGRLFLPLDATSSNMGATLSKDDSGCKLTYNNETVWFYNSDSKNVLIKNGITYINIYSITKYLNFTPIFDIDTNSVVFYFRNSNMPEASPQISASPAYIRLEDIMADGLDRDDPDYTVDSLEKLTYIADYMYERGQRFYIAWIPVYVNPKANYINNVTIDFNLYNSCFVYTLDYLVDHGGTIVLHGFTHQYGDDKSAVGNEWGSRCPYSDEDQQKRMINAKIMAARLGYNNDIFEFPHYDVTGRQLKMAEYYFKYIYQSYPSDSCKNIITYTSGGGGTFYVPTPAEYIFNAYDVESMLERLKTCISKNYAVSLFYHPTVDIKERTFVIAETNEATCTRNWYLSEQSALARIFDLIRSSGRSFSKF